MEISVPCPHVLSLDTVEVTEVSSWQGPHSLRKVRDRSAGRGHGGG